MQKVSYAEEAYRSMCNLLYELSQKLKTEQLEARSYKRVRKFLNACYELKTSHHDAVNLNREREWFDKNESQLFRSQQVLMSIVDQMEYNTKRPLRVSLNIYED